MRFHLIKFIFFLSVLFQPVHILFAQVNEKDLPQKQNPPRLVNDFADVLSSAQEVTLENKLVAFDDSTSTQIAVITIKSTEPYDIFDYAYSIGRYWGVGQEGFNNGVVILAAIDDHEVYIATGYGIEPTVTDGRAKRIIEEEIIPQFKNGNYYGGLDAATDKIIAYTQGEFSAAEDDVKTKNGSDVIMLIIIIIIILIIITRNKKNGGVTYSGRGPTYWGGGFGGFGGGKGFGGGGFGGFGGGGFGGGGAGGRW